jgi:hypothetical protein
MGSLNFDKERTTLPVIDPYNDVEPSAEAQPAAQVA